MSDSDRLRSALRIRRFYFWEIPALAVFYGIGVILDSGARGFIPAFIGTGMWIVGFLAINVRIRRERRR